MLNPGTRLGPYEVISLIGKGGMGEVYRARDLSLHRDVALKVLPPRVAADVAHADRFRREATVLASFSHRNIAAVYGFLDGVETPALVMELVDGPTLADRLADGALPLDEALPIARQIAEALEAAHAQGIVHRDLKPANIKVGAEGEVKVLDFGIAKVLDTTGSRGMLAPPASTITTPLPLTEAGVILGTGPYMSPEQARGGAVDRRSDMWAFGVVFWEMLTGRQLFAGATLSDAIAAVLNTDPDWATLPPRTPSSIRRLLQRCLQKDRGARLDSAIAARLEIDEALASPQGNAGQGTPFRWLPWAIAGVLAITSLLGLIAWTMGERPAETAVLQLSAELGAEVPLRKDLGPSVIVSPDGQTLVYASEATTVPPLLHVRRLDQLAAAPLRGTENAESPFFSPDGQWVAFFADRKLKKIAVGGGTAVTICDVRSGRGGYWTEDGAIVFAQALPRSDGRAASGSPSPLPQVLMRVPAAGGTPEPVTSLRPGELSHRWPQVLPGNRAVLYTSNTSDNWNDASVMVQPLPSGTATVVLPGSFGRYVESGHLLYVKSGTLYAAPFDAGELELTGPSAVIADNVVADATTGSAQFAVSRNGTLVFLHGRGYSPAAPSVWMDRGGSTRPLRAEPADWNNPQVSADGTQLALDISDGKQADVWVQVLGTGELSRRTFDRGEDYKPIWTPEGDRLVFTSTRDGAPNLYVLRADGGGNVERLTQSANAQSAASWHPGGRVLAFHEETPATGSDVMILPIDRTGGAKWQAGTPAVLAGGPFNQTEPAFSPDGRWVAYTSNETGRAEVFVRAFGPGGGTWQVSNGGGRDAAWSRVRPELLYFGTGQNRIMVAPFTVADGSFRADSPRAWSVTPVGRPARSGRTFALHPDGERVVVVPAETQKPDHVTLVLGFFEHLRKRVPPAK